MARVPYIAKEDLAPESQHIYDHIAQTRAGVPRTFGALLNSPVAANRVAALGEYLRFQSKLDPAVRELAILATARELNSQYVWTHHEPEARRAGVAESVIEALRDRRAPKGLQPKEAVFVQYAQELLRNRRVSDATFQGVAHLLGTHGTTDLTVNIGYYAMQAYLQAALEVELEPELTPLLSG